MVWRGTISGTEQKILFSLTEDNIARVQKESRVTAFFAEIKHYREEILSKITRIKDALQDNQKEQDACQQIIKDCEARKTTFSEIPDYVALKNEINREFEKRGILSEARFACEYVLGVKDEAWRDSIEGYLGRRRYTILVEPEYYDIADDVLNASRNKYAHLFNTKLLMKKQTTSEEDSVVRFIEVKNPVAKKYFEYQLGRFHAVAKEKVRNYENAMSKEGRVSVAMDSYFLRFDKIRFYCLGQESIELNRIKAVKRLENLKQTYGEYHEQMSAEKVKESYLDTQMQFFGEYNYDACRECETAMLAYSKMASELAALKDAQKNNLEYMELARRVGVLEQELEAIENERTSVYEERSAMQTLYATSKKDYDRTIEDITIVQKKLDEYMIINDSVARKAIEDYNKFAANGNSGSGGSLKDRDRAERNVREAEGNLRGGQAAYNANTSDDNRLPMTEDSIADYQARKSRI